MIDFDAQANLTTGLGFDPDEQDSIAPVLQGEKTLNYSLHIMTDKFDCGSLIAEGQLLPDFIKPFSYNLKRLNRLSIEGLISSLEHFKSGDKRTLRELFPESVTYKTPSFFSILKFKFLCHKERIKSISKKTIIEEP